MKVRGGWLIAGLAPLALGLAIFGIAVEPGAQAGVDPLPTPPPGVARTMRTEGPPADSPSDLLSELIDRRRTLAGRERALDARAATLLSLQRTLEDVLGTGRPRAAAATDAACRLQGGVARIYESMVPEQAAPILDRLDDETLRAVFGQMATEKVAAILAVMSRERAVAFTRLLAHDTPAAATVRLRPDLVP
jgi:hypothetical protein